MEERKEVRMGRIGMEDKKRRIQARTGTGPSARAREPRGERHLEHQREGRRGAEEEACTASPCAGLGVVAVLA